MGNYDVFGEHVFYQPNFFAKYFPKQDSFYVKTIREPFERLESHLQTHWSVIKIFPCFWFILQFHIRSRFFLFKQSKEFE